MAADDPQADAPDAVSDPDGPLDPDEVAADPAARGGCYALFARAFEHPDDQFHRALANGTVAEQFAGLFDRTPIDVPTDPIRTDEDYERLCAVYNDVFVVGYSHYEDPTDGSLETDEPPVPLYESAYRPDVSWNDINLDLARAYSYYDLQPDEADREHHDYLPLELEFAGYLARREAVADGTDAAAARLDLLDRHLRVFVEGLRQRLDDEPGTDVYDPLVAALDAFTAAERADLAHRLEEF